MTLKIGTFDGDLAGAAALMEESWAHDYGYSPRLDFPADFLAWELDSPTAAPELNLAARDGGRLVGFSAGLPRTMSIEGRTCLSILGTFLTVHPGYRRRRIGWGLFDERVRRSRERGDAFSLIYLDHSRASRRLFARYAREAGARIELLHRCPLWVRPLRIEPGDPDERFPCRPVRTEDLPACRSLLNRPLPDGGPARIWTDDAELAHALFAGPGSGGALVEREGRAIGMLSWHGRRRIAARTEPVAILENLRFEEATRGEARALVGCALESCAETGGRAALIPGPSHCDTDVLRDCGFAEFPSRTGLHLVPGKRVSDVAPAPSVYLDMR